MAETNWYYTREEIEQNSPSRLDGINLKDETFQRWCYTSFLQELGQRLNNPQKSIATSIVLCQRFFTRQSLTKNDPKTVAIICMFIAGKVQGSPRPVGDVIAVSYRVLHNKEPLRDVFERLKSTVLTGEKLVLSTLRCDLEIEHPYNLVMDWVKVSVKDEDVKRLCQAALNFVNDSLRTSLCLQFGPSQIAAGAIYLGLRMCKMELQCDEEEVWWREFDVTKRQLSEICDKMLDLYVQDFVIPVMRYDCMKIKNDETKFCEGLQGHQDDKGNVISSYWHSHCVPFGGFPNIYSV